MKLGNNLQQVGKLLNVCRKSSGVHAQMQRDKGIVELIDIETDSSTDQVHLPRRHPKAKPNSPLDA